MAGRTYTTHYIDPCDNQMEQKQHINEEITENAAILRVLTRRAKERKPTVYRIPVTLNEGECHGNLHFIVVRC